MADKTAPAVSSPLNPAAPVFTMSSKETASLPNGDQAKDSKPERPKAAKTTTAENIAEARAGVKLSGADLKKQKAAEKAARRADKVAQKGTDVQAEEQAQPKPQPHSSQGRLDANRRPSQSGKKDIDLHHKRTGSSTASKSLPLRSQQILSSQHAAATTSSSDRDPKHVPFFTHLPQRSPSKPLTLSSASREIHPAVLSLSLQLREYIICGSNARAIALMLTLKKVILSYTTPPGVALSRHLTTHLSHQISYINLARPLSVSQGNSIRWLKKLISSLDPDLADSEAKTFLSTAIEQFIREKITLADEVIAREAGDRIGNGDVILTFGKSSVVERTLLSAQKAGKQFRVIVVDSRPLFEGRNLARSLLRAGIEVQYSLLSGLGDVVQDATKCLLGAAAMLGNGKLSARSGTAMVAMMAKDSAVNLPVIVLCETVKFTGKVALDSIVMNELGEADALIEQEQLEVLTTPAPLAGTTEKGGKGDKKGKDDADQGESITKQGLEGWRDQKDLYLLNLMYDITPAEYLDMVISELGSLPPSAVPVVNGVHGGEE
jgi:translation initiation factor eIF-2B subunit delta